MTPLGHKLLWFRTTAFCGANGSAGFAVTSRVACCSGVSMISSSMSAREENKKNVIIEIKIQYV